MADDQDDKQELEQLEQSVRDTEDDLLKGAFEPEPEKPAEVAPQGEQPQGEGRPRDPATGQFVKREAAPPTAAPAPQEQGGEQPPAKPGEKPDDDILPSWRAREINDERRAALAEAERMRVENARLTAWVAQQQRAAAAANPAAQPQLPDPLLDPAGYTKAVQDGLRREFAENQMSARLEMNLELTHAIHGEKFEKAFDALCAEGQRGNNALVRHLVSQPRPGQAILDWHARNEVLRTVGNDPDAYAKKLRDDLLNDPTFLAEAAERARLAATGQLPPQGNGQQPRAPNTVVKLPPSLSKATGTAEAPSVNATDGSEGALFANAFNSPRRGRR